MTMELVWVTFEKTYGAQLLINLFENKMASFLLKIDTDCYGLRHADSNIMIGEIPVIIERDVLYVKGNKFPLTKGLIELLTKRKPKNFNNDEIMSYKTILILTNAHKRKYGNAFRLNPNKSWKYNKIISKLFPPKRKKSERSRNSTSRNSPSVAAVRATEIENPIFGESDRVEWGENTKSNENGESDVIEWDENTNPNEIVNMIRIKLSEGKNIQSLVNVLIEMGIVCG